MEDVTVDKPGRDSSWDRTQRWAPYGLPYPVSSLPDSPIMNPVTTLSQHRILLCEIMTPLGHVLYVQSRVSLVQPLNSALQVRLVENLETRPAESQRKDYKKVTSMEG